MISYFRTHSVQIYDSKKILGHFTEDISNLLASLWAVSNWFIRLFPIFRKVFIGILGKLRASSERQYSVCCPLITPKHNEGNEANVPFWKLRPYFKYNDYLYKDYAALHLIYMSKNHTNIMTKLFLTRKIVSYLYWTREVWALK